MIKPKRLLSLLLAVIMMLTMLPTNTFAEELLPGGDITSSATCS